MRYLHGPKCLHTKYLLMPETLDHQAGELGNVQSRPQGNRPRPWTRCEDRNTAFFPGVQIFVLIERQP